MTELEQTIVANAQQELAAVLVFYRDKAAGIAEEDFNDAWLTFLGHFHAMNALTQIAHQAESGLSEESRKALLQVVADHSAACQAFDN